MTEREFLQIQNLLRVYPNCCRDVDQTQAWWMSLKDYDFNRIYDAVEAYIRTETRTPVPAAVIGRIAKSTPKGNITPRFENIDGKLTKVYRCLRCHDTGLVTWDDDDGHIYGRPCLCEAGKSNYRWGFLTAEQKEEYVRVHGYHGEDLDYDVPALWAKDGIKE